MRAPYNPFARTLATQEAELTLLEPSKAAAGAGGKEQRTLDVDAFKNILMTGAPVPAGLSTDLNTARPRPISTGDPPAFDTGYEAQPESPKEVDHEYDSSSEDDENSELMGTGRLDDLAPPAPPKPKTKGPQTVSFADFDQSIPPGYMSSRSRSPQVSAQHITGILRTASPRPGSDLNKPLPAPPRDTVEKATATVSNESGPPPQTVVHSLAPVPAPSVKAIPPPPPTRKSGAGHGRVRSSSNLSNMTIDSVTSTPADSVVSTSSNKLAPPPPPTRKSGNQSIAHPPVKEAQSPAPEAKLIPPPPPPLRRLPSKAARTNPSLSRQGSEEASTTSTTTAAAPPPPPPRRPGSKRASIDGAPSSFQRRLSGEHYRGTSFDSERSASITSLQKVAETGESTEQAVVSPGTERDILAEMSAFQAEIDALSQAANGK